MACLACSEPASTRDTDRGSPQFEEARKISDPEKRARELGVIASASAALNQDEIASQAFADAFEAGLAIEDLDRQSYVLSQVLGYLQGSRLDAG